jgi:spermidine synthase
MAFCSMAVELALAQLSTILYGGTVLRYSVIIGVFIASLGFGASWWALRPRRATLGAFWSLEIALSVAGTALPLGVMGVEPWVRGAFGLEQLGFGVACVAAAVVGLLSGMELPVLIGAALGREGTDRALTARVLVGLDFLGTFLASAVTPLLLYPWLGIVGAASLAGVLNALLAGLVLAVERPGRAASSRWLATAAALVAAVAVLLNRTALTDALAARIF